VFAVTSVLGPVLGGLMTDLLSWHWIFFINLPVGAFACWAIARSLRKTVITHAHRIDYLGSMLLTASIVSLLLILALGGTEWPWDAVEIKVCAAADRRAGRLAVRAPAPRRRAGAAARPVRQPRLQPGQHR
jgi:MFS family permease